MYIKVKVIPSASREKIEKKQDDRYVISVKEPAERNLANNKLKEILAQIYNVPNSSIRIVSGHHSPSKIFSIKM